MNILRAMAAAAALFFCSMTIGADLKLDQLAARFELATPAVGPYFRAALTADVLRYSQSADLADLRVFNAAGEAMPMTLHAPAAAEAPRETAMPLPAYPIETWVHESASAGKRMEIRSRGGATTVIIEGDRPLARAPGRAAAYLLDARNVKALGVAVELDAAFDRARLVPVTIEASRDLKTWRSLVAGEPVFRLGEGETQQTRTVVRFGRSELLEGLFLRLTWAGSSQFDLRGARLLTIPAEHAPPPPETSIELGEPSRADAREIEWRVPTAVRFTQLDVRLTESNALAPVTVLGRRRIGEPWTAIGRGVVYRIRQGGVDTYSPALTLKPGSYKSLKLVIDGSGAFGNVPPTAALRIPPREVIFLARGAGPFVLAAGNAEAERASLPIATLVPEYKPDMEKSFALATIGPARIDARRTASTPTLVLGVDSRTAILWAILVAAVALLAAFAFSLLRKLKRADVNVSPPN